MCKRQKERPTRLEALEQSSTCTIMVCIEMERNGVGVILKEEYTKNVVEVKRVMNTVMTAVN